MVRVLHVIYGMNRGGIETFIMNIYRNIDRAKVQFDFLTHVDHECAYDEEIRELGGNIYYVPPRSKGIKLNKASLENFFDKHNEYKIIHQHSTSASYIVPLKIAKKYNIPVRILHSHNTKAEQRMVHSILHRINRLFMKNIATHYFACSDLAGKWMFGEDKEFRTINNGIETREFIFNDIIRNSMRKELGVEDKFVIGHIGRLTYQKNHEFLLQIFNKVLKTDDKAYLLLVGDGELKADIQRQIDELGISNNTSLLGVRSDIMQLLQAMDVFLFPSRFEGLPVTLVEAQSVGLKCIISDNITEQVAITDIIEYLSLNTSADEWAIKVMGCKDYKRVNQQTKVKDAGFDILEVSKILAEFYLNSFKESI